MWPFALTDGNSHGEAGSMIRFSSIRRRTSSNRAPDSGRSNARLSPPFGFGTHRHRRPSSKCSILASTEAVRLMPVSSMKSWRSRMTGLRVSTARPHSLSREALASTRLRRVPWKSTFAQGFGGRSGCSLMPGCRRLGAPASSSRR